VSAVSSNQRSAIPKISSNRDIVTICNTEASITFPDVAATASFAFTLNPMTKTNVNNTLVFPWLSTVAQGFGQFRFKYLRIIYSPAVGTTTAGQVALAITYNTVLGAVTPTSLNEVSSITYSGTGPVWAGSVINDSVCFAKTSSPILDEVIYTDVIPLSEQDKKWYNVGQSLGNVGGNPLNAPGSCVGFTTSAAAVVTGSLYIAYEIELKDPVSKHAQGN